MALNYSPQTWVDRETRIDAARMQHIEEGIQNVTQAVNALWDVLQKKGIAAVCESSYLPCGLAMPRKQEVYACVNRYRRLGL